MARFDVYRAPRGGGYLVDVQADYFNITATRVVMPLLPVSNRLPATKRLNPIFVIGETPHMLQPLLIATVPTKALKEPVLSLANNGDQVTAALDFMHQGF